MGWGSALWINIIGSTVSGVVAGLIVSFTLWSISHFSKPKFEFFDIGSGGGHLHYNRLRPIVIGGSYVSCHGPAMSERTPRGAYGGFYMGPKQDRVFSTSHFPGPGLPPGEIVSFTYRYAPLKAVLFRNSRHELPEIDPIALSSLQSGHPVEELRISPKQAKRWRIANVTIKPSSTRSP